MQNLGRKDKIDIILPTYNGEKYIREQIESIIGQDYTNWNLLIRDDGSKDQTLRIIRGYQQKYPDKIHIIYDKKGNLGVTYNVFEILKYAKNSYIMFCDQDDIWKVNKIRTLFEYIKKVEKNNKNQPILVHSDANIVDSRLKMIHPSFATYLHWDKRRDTLANLIQRNIVQGSSALINRKLLDKVKILANRKGLKTVYHDWWIAVVAAVFGKIYYCNKALMLYRQHDNNMLGATSNTLHLRDLLHLTGKELNDIRYRFYLSTNPLICRQILKTFSNELTKRQKQILKHYENNPNDIKEFFELRLHREFSIPQILGMILFTVG